MHTKSFKDLTYLYRSGSMPSAHSSIIMSVVAFIGFSEGPTSSVFALGVAMAAIVMYDAIHVRRSVGEQGAALEKLLPSGPVEYPHRSMGHTPIEVIVGACLGLAVAIVAFFITK